MAKAKATPKGRGQGGLVSAAAANYWHPLACRVFLHLQIVEPKLKGEKRLDRIADYLNGLGVRVRGGAKLTYENVGAAIKRKKRTGELQELRESYSWRPSELLVFHLKAEKEAAIADAKDEGGHIAAAAAFFDLPPLTASERQRAYQNIAKLAPLRLRALLDHFALEWSGLQSQSEAAGAVSKDFPVGHILRTAFPDFKWQ